MNMDNEYHGHIGGGAQEETGCRHSEDGNTNIGQTVKLWPMIPSGGPKDLNLEFVRVKISGC